MSITIPAALFFVFAEALKIPRRRNAVRFLTLKGNPIAPTNRNWQVYSLSFTKNRPIMLTIMPAANRKTVRPCGPPCLALMMQMPMQNRLASISTIPAKITLILSIQLLSFAKPKFAHGTFFQSKALSTPLWVNVPFCKPAFLYRKDHLLHPILPSEKHSRSFPALLRMHCFHG